MQLRNKLIPFFGKTIVYFIIIAILWYFALGPVYNDVMAGLGDIMTPSHDLWHEDNTIYVLGDKAENQYGIYALDLQYGLILLMALIIATPGIRITQRFKYIPIAWIVIFIIHMISILIFTWATKYDSPGGHPLVILFSIFGSSLFPIVVWGFLSFRYFLPRPQEVSHARTSIRPRGKRRLKDRD